MDIKASTKEIKFKNSKEEADEIYNNVYDYEKETQKRLRKMDNKFIFITIFTMFLLSFFILYAIYSNSNKFEITSLILTVPILFTTINFFILKIREGLSETDYILEKKSLLSNVKNYNKLKEIYESNSNLKIYYDISVSNLVIAYIKTEDYNERLIFKECKFSNHKYDYDVFELNEDGSINFTLHFIGVEDGLVKLLDDNMNKYYNYNEDELMSSTEDYIKLYNDCYQVTDCSLFDEGRLYLLISYISKSKIIRHVKFPYVIIEQNAGEKNLSLGLNDDGSIVLSSIT